MSLLIRQTFCCSSGKLGKLAEIGSEKMDKEFNIVRIIRKLRLLEIILKDSNMMTKEKKFTAKNKGPNIIRLDSDD